MSFQVEKAVWYKLFVNLVYPSIHPHDSEIKQLLEFSLSSMENGDAYSFMTLFDPLRTFEIIPDG